MRTEWELWIEVDVLLASGDPEDERVALAAARELQLGSRKTADRLIAHHDMWVRLNAEEEIARALFDRSFEDCTLEQRMLVDESLTFFHDDPETDPDSVEVEVRVSGQSSSASDGSPRPVRTSRPSRAGRPEPHTRGKKSRGSRRAPGS